MDLFKESTQDGISTLTKILCIQEYFVSLNIQSECGRIRTRKNSVFGHISRSALYSGHHHQKSLRYREVSAT